MLLQLSIQIETEIKGRLRLREQQQKNQERLLRAKMCHQRPRLRSSTPSYPQLLCTDTKVGQGRRLTKTVDSLEIRCWRRALWIPWVTRKMNEWVLKQIKPETLLEVKMTKLKLSDCRDIMRGEGNVGKNRRQQGEDQT